MVIENADVDIELCNFTNNRGFLYGGAIFVKSQTFTLSDSVFVDNECNNSITSQRFQPCGGAIYFYENGGNKVINSCKFIRNKAKSDGGAIYFEFYLG